MTGDTDNGPPAATLGLLRSHPGVAISIAYLFVSLLGLTFSWALYRRFDVNFFQFADVSDFLMGAFREPMTFVLAGSALVTGWLAMLLNRVEERIFADPESMNFLGRAYGRLRNRMRPETWPVVLTVLYCVLFIDTFASREARSIREGEAGTVTLETAAGQRLQLLFMGATSRFLFFYDPQDAHLEILPHESVARIVHAPPAPSAEPDPPEPATESEPSTPPGEPATP